MNIKKIDKYFECTHTTLVQRFSCISITGCSIFWSNLWSCIINLFM